MPPPSPPPTPAGLPTGSSATGSLTDEDEIPWAYRVDALWTLFWNDPDLLEADCVIVVHPKVAEGGAKSARTYHVHLDKVCTSTVLLNAFLGRRFLPTPPNTTTATADPVETTSASARRDLSQLQPTIHLDNLPDPATFPLVLHKLYFGHDASFAHDGPGSKHAVEANRKALGLLGRPRPVHRHSLSQPLPSRERHPYFAPALQLYRSHSSASHLIPLPVVSSSASVPCPAASEPSAPSSL